MKKRYGQHFLSDRNILQRIVDFAHIHARRHCRRNRARRRRAHAGACGGRSTRHRHRNRPRPHSAAAAERCLRTSRSSRRMPSRSIFTNSTTPFHLVGNLPYNVATPLLEAVSSHRATAFSMSPSCFKKKSPNASARKPGTADYGPLSVLIQYYADADLGIHRSARRIHAAAESRLRRHSSRLETRRADCARLHGFCSPRFSFAAQEARQQSRSHSSGRSRRTISPHSAPCRHSQRRRAPKR